MPMQRVEFCSYKRKTFISWPISHLGWCCTQAYELLLTIYNLSYKCDHTSNSRFTPPVTICVQIMAWDIWDRGTVETLIISKLYMKEVTIICPAYIIAPN